MKNCVLFIAFFCSGAIVFAADGGKQYELTVVVGDGSRPSDYHRMLSTDSMRSGRRDTAVLSHLRQRAPSLTRSLSHPNRLNHLPEEIDAALGVLDVVSDKPFHAQGVVAAVDEEVEGSDRLSVEAVASDPTIEAIRLLARRTKEANDDRRSHEALVAQHLKESRELAQRADKRAEDAEKRAARARKMAIVFALGNGIATVSGWVWSSGILHRWLGIDDGTDGGAE